MKSDYEFDVLSVMIGIVSFLGFWLENIWLAVTKGVIDNRNMTFPFLLGYGIIIVGMYLLIGTPNKFRVFNRNINVKSNIASYAVYFLASMVIVTVGELVLGIFVEKVFGFHYWNYEKLPMNFTRYTSLPTSFGFSLIITLFMGRFFDMIMNGLEKLPPPIVKVVGSILIILMVVDLVVSFVHMYKHRSLNIRWIKRIKGYSGVFN